MFKVQENADGSMSIFCSKSGKLLYKTGKKLKDLGLGCNVDSDTDSSPKNQSCGFNDDTRESVDIQIINDEDPDLVAKESANVEVILDKQPEKLAEECNLPAWAEESNEDFSAECITSEDFARCLNLVPTDKLKKQPITKLKSEFPLRLLSRTEALISNGSFSYEIPITSSRGLNVLRANKHKNIYSDESVEERIRYYENFCHSQVNSSDEFNRAKFRPRDKRSQNSKFHTTHRYTFNRTQRLENLITMKTGLEPESRKLLLRCNKRLTVSVKRLSEEEIKYWMQKRARLDPMPADLVQGEESFSTGSNSHATVIEQNAITYVDLCSENSSESSDNDDPVYLYEQNTRKVSSFQGVFNCSSSALRNGNGLNPKQLNSHFEKHKDCLSSLNSKARTNLELTECKLNIDPQNDDATCLPFSPTIADKNINLLTNSNWHNYKNSHLKVDIKKYLNGSNSPKNKFLNPENVKSSESLKPHCVNQSNSLKSSMNKPDEEVTIIQVVDLTASLPNSPTNPTGTYSFHCYGCGHDTKNHEKLEANLLAFEHLKAFHCVSDPESFLTVNSTSLGTVIEAFPGYKKD